MQQFAKKDINKTLLKSQKTKSFANLDYDINEKNENLDVEIDQEINSCTND